jgi:outer membrane biosynthesis protein TonB
MFKLLDTKHKRKSAALTSAVMAFLFFLLFFVGLKYLDPPIEYGIAVNFGTSDFGKGNIQPTEPLKAAVAESKAEEEIKVSEPVESKPVESSEEVITQNTEDAIAIQNKIEAQKKAEEEAKLEKQRKEQLAKEAAEREAKKRQLDALIGGVSNSDGTANGGEGNDSSQGDKGKITGDPNADGYYGTGGTGSGGDYQLGNRKPLSRPKPNYICNEEGLVVVRIEVDKNGNVVNAEAGVKGSTNTASCLLSQAKEAALKTKWQPDTNAPSKQIGTIKYRFSLSQ